jgi:hypothetical protein
MAKTYSMDSKLLVDRPVLTIADKKYEVDNRKSTFDKINDEIQKQGDSHAMDIIVKTALGDKAKKEIDAMDLPMSGYKNLVIYIMAAIQDVTFEVAEARFQSI